METAHADPAPGLSAAHASALARLRASPRPRLLFVSHGFGGGVRRHIDELAAAIEADAEVLLLQPAARGFLELAWLRRGATTALWFEPQRQWDLLVATLAAVGIARVHFHHVHRLPRAALELPRLLGCPYDVTLHDHFPACTAYHMTAGDGRYCGGDPHCGRCLESGPAQWGLSIEAWRALFASWLGAAARVIAPSHDCARHVRDFFPAVQPLVWPHPERPAPTAGTPLRVLVPGAISPAKGVDVLEACARDAAGRGLPLHFRVVGFLSRPIAQWPQLPLGIAGEYPEGTLESLIAIERGDVFFFPAQCPETYSYTLSAALATGLPLVATDLGALTERLAGRPHARVVPWNAPPAAMNDALLASARSAVPSAGAAPADTFPAYRARYVEPLGGVGDRALPPLPALPAACGIAPQPDPDGWTLAALFRDGIGCGKASSRTLLEQRAAPADAQLEAGRGELAAARAQLARMEASRSWRLTAPLRALARWLGR